jgi:formimidoylglutamase
VTVRAPHTRPGADYDAKPGRLAARLQRASHHACRCALLGLPDDLGVQLNGGRPGAKTGPSQFRAALARFGVAWDGLAGRELDVHIFDAGDVEPAPGEDEAALLETHARVLDAVAFLHEHGLVPVCVGGGHDLSLPSISALSRRHGAALGGINLDAHLDVRTRVGSGMPFRRLIDAGYLDPQRFAEVGLGRFSNDAADLHWISGRGAQLIFAEALLEQPLDVPRLLNHVTRGGPAFLSIDLDALDQTVAPAVSAPSPLGVRLHDAARLAEAAGAHPLVRHFDLMEFCPRFDLDSRTARSAVLLFLHFVAGLVARPA